MPTLRRRIALPVLVLTVVAGVAIAFLAHASWQEARALARTSDEVRAATALAFALSDAVHEEESLVATFRGPSPAPAARVAEASAETARLVAEIGARRLAPGALGTWESFLAARGSLIGIRDQIRAASDAGDATRLELAFDKWDLMSDRAAALVRNLGAFHMRQLESTVAELQRRRARSLATAAAAIALGLAAAASFAFALGQAVVRPIGAMAAAAERISEGSTVSAVPGAERRDELGVLARSLNAMTERLRASNARLADAVQARDEFLSVASHELKTPLTSLGLRLGQLSRLAARDAGEVPRDVLARAVEVMERQVGTLGKLVANLLDVTRISAGRLDVVKAPLRLGDVVREVVEQLATELAAARCTVQVEGAPDVIVDADGVRLEQVLLNLLGNAVKYAPGTPVVVRVGRTDAEATIDVEDSGPGIAPVDQERVFSRFERAVSSDHVSGLGLGLYIAREIARAHGGELTVWSAAGQGSRFTVHLPRSPAPPAPATSVRAP